MIQLFIYHNGKIVKKRKYYSLERAHRYCDHIERLGKTFSLVASN